MLLWIPHVEAVINAHHDLEFKNLKSLTLLDKSDPSCIRFMEWVIQHAHNLQIIEAINLTAYRQLLSRTLRQRPLKKVGFHCTIEPQHDEYQFLQHHVQLGAESHLQEIRCILHSISEGHDSWIFLIPKLTQLKTLELCFESNHLVMMQLKTFLEKVSEVCMTHEKVIVKSIVFPLSSKWIRHLSKHRNLQEMIIDTTHIPDHLMNELESFSYLKRLHLKYHIKDWHSL
ncbi:predicted protein [Lichtheimia corymbifera JMRC:FSU:9682]|uniref:F-box domain-containing protein n=1 Tax=Lichtheimia corymbifera JMRC:FSU:9682 TaxID=1263082 RepID=A0A068S5W4_9FUNG|nr:predicted protein [Lichtheimia corymbifera JMRC:FSU:9682]